MKKSDENQRSIESFEIEFFEKLLAENSDFVDALIPLAEAYTKAGEYAKGLDIDKRLSQLRPNDDIVYYNLACSLSLSNKIDETIETLEKAVKLGYNDFDYMNEDKDLCNVRNDKRYKEMFNLWKTKTRG